VLFFEYELPNHLIAQQPLAERDSAKLLVVYRDSASLKDRQIEHRQVRDLPELLSAGDLVIFNNTKVLPARLIGTRANTGGKWECLFVCEVDDQWEVMSQTRGYPQIGESFITDTGLTLTLTGRTADKHWLLRPNQPGSTSTLLTQFGHIPLPPYIRKGRANENDSTRYQTVYAEKLGSVAAPTAGLHFTPDLLNRLKAKQIDTAQVTLHVGLGTFAPINHSDPLQHVIHKEWCEVPEETVQKINDARAQGKNVIAVGTTTTRCLESASQTQSGKIEPYSGETNIYIHPPYQFRAIDGLMTNFHLPKTTLLLMVQALSGSETLRKAYQEAISKEYRFFSYGDAMLILPG
jgi:S-adenosylmethionine:tRNA ribosyltransferase-isomerase